MSDLIERARLTEEEQQQAIFTTPVGGTSLSRIVQAVADAQLRKALRVVAEWLEELEDGLRPDLFAYGGPASCEYGCIPGAIMILTESLQSKVVT